MTELNRLEDLLSAVKSPYAIVDFYGTWCPPCKIVAPQFEMLARKYPQVKCVKVNVDDPIFEEAVKVCKITSLPTFFYYKQGKHYDTVTGSNISLIEAKLVNMLKN